MKININNIPVSLPADCLTVHDLIIFKGYRPDTTSVAINTKKVNPDNWRLTRLNPFDNIEVSATPFDMIK